MYRLITSIFLLSICQQSFSSEDNSCQFTLISRSNVTVTSNKRNTSSVSNIKSKAPRLLLTIESLGLSTDILHTLWKEDIFYILDLVHYTPARLLSIGINNKSITQIRTKLLSRGLHLRMRFDHNVIAEVIDMFNKKQKKLYDTFVSHVNDIHLNLNRGEFINRLKAEIDELKRNYIYRPIVTENYYYHEDGVFGDIEWNLKHSHKLSQHLEGIRKWILEEMEIIMEVQGMQNKYEI